MKLLFVTVLPLLLVARAGITQSADNAPISPAASESDILGAWSGSITANRSRVPFTVAILRDTAGFRGLITSPGIGFIRSPTLGRVRVEGSTVRFGAGLSEGALSFIGTLNGVRIAGSVTEIGMVNGRWSTVGDTLPFVLERTTATESLPYELRDTSFTNDGNRLAATLFIPRRPLNNAPGAVFVHGSGPATREEGNFLADHFARRGFIALVYDKRGAGKSEGDWIAASVPDLAGDALAAHSFLTGIDGVNPKKVGLIGVSQGGWVAVNAAARSKDVGFIMLQAGPVQPPHVNDLWRFKQRLGRAGVAGADSVRALAFIARDARVSATRTGYDELVRDVESVKDSVWFKALGWSPAPLDAEYRTWSAKIGSYEPAGDLSRISVPALWLYGNADLAVDGNTEATVACAMRGRYSALRQVIVLDQADHGLRIDRPLDGVFPHVHPAFRPALDAWIDSAVLNSRTRRSSVPCPVTLR